MNANKNVMKIKDTNKTLMNLFSTKGIIDQTHHIIQLYNILGILQINILYLFSKLNKRPNLLKVSINLYFISHKPYNN